MLGATALLVAPSANADQTVATNGHKGNPPGNNGTIKIEGADIQSGPPDNNPHQGCTFVVEFYNYDKNDSYNATVTFEDHAPTADGGLTVVSGNLHPFIGEDAAGGGTDLDARETYTLSFTGEPHPKQGFHVKLTVNAPGSIGADKKHKVFWVEGCGTPSTTPPTSPSTTPPTTPETTPPTTPPSTPETTPAESPTTTAPTTPATPPSGTPSTPPSDTPATPPTVTSPTATATQSTPGSDVPENSESPAPGVPTEVDAGFGGGSTNSVAGSNSPFSLAGGLLLAAGGLMLAGGAVVALRRRGRHSA